MVALGCWVMLAVRNGAQQVDSGWAVAVPSPIAQGTGQANTEQELVIRHVLDQTQAPLLRHQPVSTPATATDTNAKAGLRFADASPSKTEGWRPAGSVPAPAKDATSTQPPLAQPRDTKNSTIRGYEAECDCSGGMEPSHNKQPLPLSPPTQPNAAASSSLSQPVLELPAGDSAADDGSVKDNAPLPPQNENAPSIHASALPESNGISTDDTEAARNEATSAAPVSVAPAKPQAVAAAPGATAPMSVAPTAKAPRVEPADDTASNLPPLSKQLIGLRSRLRAVLKGYYRKPLNSHDNDPWECMHGMLSYGVYSRIHAGGPNGELITSVGWLCYNKPCKGQTLLYVTPSGELRAKYGVGLQGHLGQFLAMLAQCHVSPDYPIHVGDHDFTIKDLIEAEKKTCYPKSELTFKLIALQHYADLNDKWENDQGIEWDFPRLVHEELDQPIRGAACGGTHRLSGLSLVVKTRLRRGEPLDGEYAKADEFVKRYQQYAFRLQNRDGSLSTAWFRGAGDEEDIDRRIKTTGHILEWLCYSLSDEQLREQRTIHAVAYLTNLMYSNYDHEWEIGPRSHALHALLLYDQRVFQPYDKEGEMTMFRATPTLARKAPTPPGTNRR